MKNLVLIGLPGAGKTTCAKQLAAKLGRKFIDMDEMIEQKAGLSIKDIFATWGEPAFRASETALTGEIAGLQNTIIATGGGSVLKAENMAKLSQNGIIIFLNRPPEAIMKDVQTANRPLLQEDKNRVLTLYQERLPLYQKYADFEMNRSDSLTGTLAELARIAGLDTKAEKRFTVIGSPIQHSLSPNIHLPLLKRFYHKVSYTKTEIAKDQLAPWLQYIRENGIDGFNITMPHKEAILPFLDDVDKEALYLQSVNTVTGANGKLKGYNTDGEGFRLALATKSTSFTSKQIIILGAGGAAASLALKAALEKAAALTILARTSHKAKAILEKAALLQPGIKLSYAPFTAANLFKKAAGADILINATPLGMTGLKEDFQDLGFLSALKPDCLICDLIYSPAQTTLLKAAANLGLPTLGGLQMLIYQAIMADNFFLGCEQNLIKAYNIVEQNLKGRVDIS